MSRAISRSRRNSACCVISSWSDAVSIAVAAWLASVSSSEEVVRVEILLGKLAFHGEKSHQAVAIEDRYEKSRLRGAQSNRGTRRCRAHPSIPDFSSAMSRGRDDP